MDPLDNYDVLRAVYERTRNYVREQDTELARLRGIIDTREDALRQFTKTMDEQEKALAEARELIKWLPEIATEADGDGHLAERARGSHSTRKAKMLDDSALQFYLERAKSEQNKGSQWVMFTPRLAIEILEELLRWRHTDAAAPKMSLSIARRNEDTQKS